MTSQEIHKRMLRLFPDFRGFSDAHKSFMEKEGAPISCGEVFECISRYYKQDCQNWGPVALDDISTLLEDCMISPRSASAKGARSFVEGISGEMAGDCFDGYLGPRAQTYLDTCLNSFPVEKIKKSELISKFSKILLGKRP
jgi:hypothetical protein